MDNNINESSEVKKENQKKVNILLIVTIFLFALIILGITYSYLFDTVRITNGVYNTVTHCLYAEYGIENGNNTSDISGELVGSTSPSGGLMGRVSLKISDQCDLEALGTLKLHIDSQTSESITMLPTSYCEDRRTGERLNEYTDEATCQETSNRKWYNVGALDSYCINPYTLERISAYTESSTCASNGGYWIDDPVTVESPLKYAVYDNANATGIPLSSGRIYASDIGNDVAIYDDFNVDNTLRYYYIYIWLDQYLVDSTHDDLIFGGDISASVTQNYLPIGYKRVKYIESTGTQYIDTGVLSNNLNRINTTFSITSAALSIETNNVVAGYSSGDVKGRTQFSYSTSMFYGWGSGYTSSSLPLNTSKHTLTLSKDAFVLDDITVYTPSSSDFSSVSSLCLFARCIGSGNEIQVGYLSNGMRIWRLDITTDNTLVRDFVPVYRESDLKPGLYDLVNKQFYTNAGTGEFLYE